MPITSYPGLEHAASISPDGRYVAFARSRVGETRSDIYVKQLDSDATLRVSTDPALESSPAWSPDGTAIAFLRDIGPGRSALVLVPLLGGPERMLAEVNAPPASGLSWSPDGSSVAVIERLGEGADQHSAFQLVPVEDGSSLELGVSLAELSKANYPAFSPNGTQIAWLGTKGPWQANLYVAELPGNSIRRLAALDGQGAGIAWTHDGQELIVGRFTPLRVRSLWRVRLRDGSVSEVAVGDNH
ncbi:MAG: hypothetical protein GY953_54220, partial [bacterium]|nr:hypothetical protein [bacterium]